MSRAIYGTPVRSERLTDNAIQCARCGRDMAQNSRVKNGGVTPICNDCRESDHGLVYLWGKKREVS